MWKTAFQRHLERRYWMRYVRGEDVFHRDIGLYISGVSIGVSRGGIGMCAGYIRALGEEGSKHTRS
jgi:hypothetical protein